MCWDCSLKSLCLIAFRHWKVTGEYSNVALFSFAEFFCTLSQILSSVIFGVNKCLENKSPGCHLSVVKKCSFILKICKKLKCFLKLGTNLCLKYTLNYRLQWYVCCALEFICTVIKCYKSFKWWQPFKLPSKYNIKEKSIFVVYIID